MTTRVLMTAEEFDQLPVVEGQRQELLDGELTDVSSATPRHNLILVRLTANVLSLGLVPLPDTEFDLGAERRLRPDLVVFTGDQWAKVEMDTVPVRVVPMIAIEIVSPSDLASYHRHKQRIYLNAGIAEVWTVYPEQREIEIRSAHGTRILGANETLVSDAMPALSIPVDTLFA